MECSVLMATYNGESYIIEQLESIMNQTYTIDEVIISDDNSTDNTVQIINEFIMKNNLVNWKLIVNSENKGWRKNFIDLLKESSKKIIFFADQDDIWKKNKIAIMREIMINNEDISVLMSDIEPIFGNGGVLAKHNTQYGKLLSVDKNLYKVIRDKSNFQTGRPGCTYCLREDIKFDIVDIFNLDNGNSHDGIAYHYALANNKLYLLKEKLIEYRLHQNSSFRKENDNSEKKYFSKIKSNTLIFYDRYFRYYNSIFNFLISKENIDPSVKEFVIEYKNIYLKKINYLEGRQTRNIISSPKIYFSMLEYIKNIGLSLFK